MKIYTRTGDDGTTGLLYGGRVPKDSPRTVATGDADEAQAALGLARAAAGPDGELADLLVSLERELYVVMAELATADGNRHRLVAGETLVTPAMVEALERRIDELSSRFQAPHEFVVPGQNPVSAALDLARAVVRRAERSALGIATEGSMATTYLNRLSDLLWTVARWQEGEFLPARAEKGAY
ncbi:MAG: cob(I)yrinic acid a,c-diamide adenosyltransferase [Acidimicrobiales bacterium]